MNGRIERDFPVPDITNSRMQEWAQAMIDENATPIFSLAITHGPLNEGELHLYQPENLGKEELVLFLAFALREAQKMAEAA